MSEGLVVDGLTVVRGGRTVVRGVGLHVEPGRVVCVLGPNGAGKSTTFKMLTGLLRPSSGTIRILGHPARGDSALYRQIGLVAEQEVTYPFLTGHEFVRLNEAADSVDHSGRLLSAP